MKREFKVFADFDGTITLEDVGDAMFRRFGRTEQVNGIISNLLENKITARDCWVQLCDSIPKVNIREVESFIDTMEIDSSFPLFVKFCREMSIPLYVLSDGFDLYIDRIFSRENLTGIKYFANKLTINEEGSFIPSFPYWNNYCRNSANCKRDHILNNSSDDDITVFIGDGHSDKETILYCDYIFAKDSLLKFCEKERISYFPYSSFNDVTQRLLVLLAKKNPAKRHQAELKRQEAYRQE